MPPTKKEVEKVIATATGKTRLFVQVMRWSGMAISDKLYLKREKLEGNLIRGNRRKTDECYRVRIPQQLAVQLQALPCDNRDYFFLDDNG